jgi:hypothetical protein
MGGGKMRGFDDAPSNNGMHPTADTTDFMLR